jgi:hypothetical protein
MKIETKKRIFFGSTGIVALVTVVFFSHWVLNIFTGGCGSYALFGSYKLNEYLNQSITGLLLPFCFLPVSFFSLSSARRYFKPYNRVVLVCVSVNRFFLWGTIPLFIFLFLSAGLCLA